MTTYYNENDPKAAAWLRELIKKRLIADGEVDVRSIEDVAPIDLQGFTQCHFFAGIGGWSYALGRANWPDDRPVWTGSCPCQPFSAAGKGSGFADERHLWPAWFHLIEQCRPAIVFGEQVAGKAGLTWLDLVSSDLQGAGYAVAAADICAAGIGAPHIRQRLYFIAERLEYSNFSRSQRRDLSGDGADQRPVRAPSMAGTLEYAESDGRIERRTESSGRSAIGRCGEGGLEHSKSKQMGVPGCTWFDGRPADWIECQDGKARPIEPGTFPLAHGVSGRVGLLRGYGNAIVPQVAQAFIESVM